MTYGTTFDIPISKRKRRVSGRTLAKLLGILVAEIIRQLLN